MSQCSMGTVMLLSVSLPSKLRPFSLSLGADGDSAVEQEK